MGERERGRGEMSGPIIASAQIKSLVRLALAEDRAKMDVTSRALFERGDRACGYVIFKGERAVVCGMDFAREAFCGFDPCVRARYLCREGRTIRRGAKILSVKGPARAILAAERTALNFICHLSGIATETARFVQAAASRKARFVVSDTRKTHPGLRLAEKYAVKTGGGEPHRRDLASFAMIKDNHLRVFQRLHGPGWGRALAVKIRGLRRRGLEVEVEVQSLKELSEVLAIAPGAQPGPRSSAQGAAAPGALIGPRSSAQGAARPDWIMLDNFNGPVLRRAVDRIRSAAPEIKIEVSGGVRLDGLLALASLPIDRVSSGAIVHSAPFADFSLEFF